uniref:Uncharacterized protein n=1 Tax=Rhizophora mucronata TaxID=61149 RepID=A0A2P2NAI2_RHIMU
MSICYLLHMTSSYIMGTLILESCHLLHPICQNSPMRGL